jgi:uncharacterized glyoxalase superfamily protein PhnB
MRIVFLVAVFFTISINANAMSDTTPKQQYLAFYGGLISKDIKKTREFYAKWFGFTAIFESSWFVLMASPGDNGTPVAFMSEEHPSAPPSTPAVRSNSGIWLTIQVADAELEYERLTKSGLPIHYHLKREPWGQKRFGVIDPNGIYLDIVEQVEPEAGYWDKYMGR